MIRNKLNRGIPFFVALGLMITPVAGVHAESYGTGLTRGIINDEIDPGFTIKPEVFVNSEKINTDDIKIINGIAALPLEDISHKMGDFLLGSNDESYMLRKADRLIIIIPSENKYILNGVENTCEFTIVGDKTYAPYSFFNTVMAYDMNFEGNSIIIGKNDGNNISQGAEETQTVLNNSYENAVWKLVNGTWYYLNGDTKVTGWAAYNNSWYYMNKEGKMQTGWVNVNNKWYFLNEDGAMQTGWIESNGQYYYLNKNGDMAFDTVVDGYILAENGVCISLY